ncbi:hypothetical protein [Fulvivirga lutimaris]|uniref:hypothetical protein n=1 Tax=Fulvivirga lutimaris TaxID=1819566 RepID=UPI0012BBB818|nr:hypothetical protein [Fulvivirga lutimaris]MTI40968.1 hypothetical protein [Fulvivirga lutimaris]
MWIIRILLVATVSFVGSLLFAQEAVSKLDDQIPLEQFVGYYDVGIKPGKPFFRSRWYLREGKLFAIYDSDKDRELQLYENGKLRYNIVMDESELPEVLDDTTYYLILNVEEKKLKSFIVKRPRRDWPTDLYGARNEKLSPLAVDTEESLKETTSTDHFTIQYSYQDAALIPKLSSTLEDRYDNLLSTFGVENLPITNIRIYPDLETYHNAVLTPDAPNWQMGRAWDSNEIRMLSPITAEKESGEAINLNEIVLHEFVHCIHLNLINETTRVPGWFWEGLAMYKGCCKWIENPKELDYVKKKKYPSLKKISNERNSEMKYDLAYYLIEYIDKKYGWDKVLELIDSNGNVESTLGVSNKGFEKAFYTYIDEEY